MRGLCCAARPLGARGQHKCGETCLHAATQHERAEYAVRDAVPTTRSPRRARTGRRTCCSRAIILAPPPTSSGWTRHQPRCFRHERLGWYGRAGDVWLLLGGCTWRTGRLSAPVVRTCPHLLAPPVKHRLPRHFFYSGAGKKKKKNGAAGAGRRPGRDGKGKGRNREEEGGSR